MSNLLTFTSSSARYELPFLFAGQAQKEVFVNEALARIDCLSHPAAEAETGTPPSSPQDGQCWLINSSPTGDWAGHAGELACMQSGNWLYIAPQDGMRIFDKDSGQFLLYDGLWSRAAAVTLPSGGATQDSEARTAIAELVTALIAAGILD